ncbi:type II toxin-antitoxin system PemK/MazF family toxin [Thalassospira profundimaris]|jgi:mRNA interferase MazF|uniref:type II toxin-antitoxin system PemK/MazF family toxin n=1 Tax=Thalassospira profundimaris TaxID=502049 RepID=UPI000DEE00B3
MCPIASKEKGYPFETALADGLKISGVVLADQIRSLDWRARKASQADTAPSVIVDDVLAKLETLLG